MTSGMAGKLYPHLVPKKKKIMANSFILSNPLLKTTCPNSTLSKRTRIKTIISRCTQQNTFGSLRSPPTFPSIPDSLVNGSFAMRLGHGVRMALGHGYCPDPEMPDNVASLTDSYAKATHSGRNSVTSELFQDMVTCPKKKSNISNNL
ncbi:cGMP-specific 3',5'-cyclic phosphodiesterase [Caerostris extrusa]|uniref:cGMP-specific 3',5'-cyclic phosphodiesterase n=1 Tax=Caerostris extrusa TaxID=172846 RepID=A0AAV4XI91_CAEEX|nr:cGMP-specific 3',5'-cyclic phosphodiesterase [Caerostris extrusa]